MCGTRALASLWSHEWGILCWLLSDWCMAGPSKDKGLRPTAADNVLSVVLCSRAQQHMYFILHNNPVCSFFLFPSIPSFPLYMHFPLFKRELTVWESMGTDYIKTSSQWLWHVCVCVCVYVPRWQASWDTHIIPEPWGQADGLPSRQTPGLPDKRGLAMKSMGGNYVPNSMCVCVKGW